MAYDEKLADRVRHSLARRSDIEERSMFGGIAFMAHGRAACLGCVLLGTWGDLGHYSHCLVSGARLSDSHAVADRARRSLAHTLGEAVAEAGT